MEESDKKEEKTKKKSKKLPKDVLNIIRTTMRNNIELTNIADNKANVLLGINALMLTFLVPLLIPYTDVIKHYHLTIPLSILVGSGFITIYLSVLVLKPGKFFANSKAMKKGDNVSPFFFGNFYKMNKEEYKEYVNKSVVESSSVKDHLTDDLHYIGSRLGRKMELIRIAFNIFMIGFFLSMTLALILFMVIPSV